MRSACRAKATVLVVEDEALSRELLTQLLRAAGFEVMAPASGETALLSLCHRGEAIDWLVSKLRLPGLVCGGILADEYREHHPDRPVLLLAPLPDRALRSVEPVIWVPPAAPMRVLEVLQALHQPEPVGVLPFPGSQAA
jgi:CheY-like chemotaxis protein